MVNSVNIPIFYEENIGQQDNEVRFMIKRSNQVMFFTKDEIIISLMSRIDDNNIKEKDLKKEYLKKENDTEVKVNTIRIKLKDCNENVKMYGIDKLEFKLNYFKGNDESKYVTDVHTYEKIVYENIYDNIELVFYSQNGNIKHDFIVKTNANVSDINLDIQGYKNIEIDEDGSLNIYVSDDVIKFTKPFIYQKIDDNIVEVKGEFILKEDEVKFKVEEYNNNYDLVIDPDLIYGSYIGGSVGEHGASIVIDNNIAYITGYTSSTDFPTTPNGYDTSFNGGSDVFLIKIDTGESGSAGLLYGSYIGGSSIDAGIGIAINNSIAYITGNTFSSDFPTTPSGYDTSYNGDGDVFLIKIDTSQSGVAGLLYGSYIGGTDYDSGRGIAIDNNIAYITGETESSNFPTTPNGYDTSFNGGRDVFLIKIDTGESGSAGLLYGSYIGGSSLDIGVGIVIDNNIAYITGQTTSSDFPTTSNGYDTSYNGSGDVFLIKIDTAKSGVAGLLYGSYIGGTDYDSGRGIAIDNNIAYITGETESSNFPTTPNGYDTSYNGDGDVFLIKIDTAQSGVAGLLYGSYIGGSSVDIGRGIAIDNNIAYITGETESSNFPTTSNGYDTSYNGNQDAFLIKIDTGESGVAGLLYGSYIGGSSLDIGIGIVIDNNIAYITGRTTSSDFPTTPNGYDTSYNGAIDAFLIKLSTEDPIIRIKKNIVGRIDSSDQFDLIINGTPSDTDTTTGSATGIQSEEAFIDAISGNTYIIDEDMATGSVSNLSDYIQTVSATNATLGGTDVSGVNALGDSITVASGDDITVEITNDTPPPSCPAPISETALSGKEVSGNITATSPVGLTINYTSTQATDGSVSINSSNGDWTYTSNEGYAGSDSFIVTATDSLGKSCTTTVNIAVITLDFTVVSSLNKSSVTSGEKIICTTKITNTETTPIQNLIINTPPECTVYDGLGVTINGVLFPNLNPNNPIEIGANRPDLFPLQQGEFITVSYGVIVINCCNSNEIRYITKVTVQYLINTEIVELTKYSNTAIASINGLWTQKAILDKIIKPKKNPCIKDILSTKSSVEIISQKIIKTPKCDVKNSEGLNLTGKKLLINGILKSKIEYSSTECSESVYVINHKSVFSVFIIIPENTLPNQKFKVKTLIEDENAYACNLEEILKTIVLYVGVEC